MTDAEPEQRPRRRRLWRCVRLTLWVLFLVWFARYAYIRWTTPPAAWGKQTARHAEHEALAEQYLAAVSSLPPAAPTTSVPAWAWGMGGDVASLAEALRGAWSPNERADLRQSIQYVQQPGTKAALDRIVATVESARAGGLDTVLPTDFRPASGMPLRPDDFTWPVAVLTFRARQRHAAQSDPAGALADLRAALLIGQRDMVAFHRTGGFWWGWHDQLDSLPEFELGCLAQEHDVPPPLAREMIAFLQNELSLSVSEEVSFASGLHQGIEQLLDRYYTNDSNGNGWLVLSAATDWQPMLWMGASSPRSRIWNLFSPLFSDRRTVAAKLTGRTSQLSHLDELDFPSALDALSGTPATGSKLGLLDGPVATVAVSQDGATVQGAFARVAQRRATVVMLALSAYKHDHGEYPPTLEALVPGYLEEIPIDVTTQNRFRYVPGAADSPTTYELGPSSQVTVDPHSRRSYGELGYRDDSYVPRRVSEDE